MARSIPDTRTVSQLKGDLLASPLIKTLIFVRGVETIALAVVRQRHAGDSAPQTTVSWQRPLNQSYRTVHPRRWRKKGETKGRENEGEAEK